MDQATQQNAALVEEATAAAQSLQQQAHTAWQTWWRALSCRSPWCRLDKTKDENFFTPRHAVLQWLLGGCTTSPQPPPPPPSFAHRWHGQPCSALHRPGGTLEIVRGAGGEYGVCHLADGVVMDEWALFYRDHPQNNSCLRLLYNELIAYCCLIVSG